MDTDGGPVTGLLGPLERRLRGAAAPVAERAYATRRDGETIWERDWDVLCVLDACRVDLMREVAAADSHGFLPGPETVGTLWSVGSQSAEWMDRTFSPRHRDRMATTAYVTGNPFSAQPCDHLDSVSEDVLPLGDEEFGLLYEAWRDDWIHEPIPTMPPRPLTDAAIATWRDREEFGVDRMVVHYMQPHAPFRSHPEWVFGDADPEGWGLVDDDVGKGHWGRARDGDLDWEEFWAAYRDNLDWVLEEVSLLVENCDGSVVLTSDHGNAAGEWGVWSHPPETHLPALRSVPWVEVDGHDAETHQPDVSPSALCKHGERDGDGDSTVADEKVEQRLADLGYR